MSFVRCFHCGEPVSGDRNYPVEWRGEMRSMCCPGCQAVTETIIAAGLDEYYQRRTATAEPHDALLPQELQRLSAYNKNPLAEHFSATQDNLRCSRFSVEGMTCAACSWLIETRLAQMQGVVLVEVNAASNTARIDWDPQHIGLGDILLNFEKLGYQARPLNPQQLELSHHQQQAALLKRLGIAGLGMMQVMMFAVGLYLGVFDAASARFQTLLQISSLLITSVVVFYSAQPFFQSAWHNLRHWHLSMNTPVALAIATSYLVSSYHTLIGQGDVYFDSVVMFTFFLLLGRFLQARTLWRANQLRLGKQATLPDLALVKTDDLWRWEPTASLAPGQIILTRPGDVIAADGRVLKGESEVDQALLNGEHLPLEKRIGANVLAGSINLNQPLEIVVTHGASERYLQTLLHSQQQALTRKPSNVSAADTWAHYFVLVILLASVSTALYWSWVDPEKALVSALAVLVITCPCALSLAMPAAFTAAMAKASNLGFIINNGELFERLPHCTSVAFDKTGTLTHGDFEVIDWSNTGWRTDAEVAELVGAIEHGSAHPVAIALRDFFATRTNTNPSTPADDAPTARTIKISSRQYRTGFGLIAEGTVATADPVQRSHHYTLGAASSSETPNDPADGRSLPVLPLTLCEDNRILATIRLSDRLRSGALKLIKTLQARGLKTLLLSGDPAMSAESAKKLFGVDTAATGLSADQKLTFLAARQAQGEHVLTLGDGVNDAPLLAQANVSIAVGCASAITQASADAILVHSSLDAVTALLCLSRKTRRIIRQNLIWAFAYNAASIPLAAMGLVPPWLAAIGMSFSSLLVVTNALRLNRVRLGV